MKTHDLKIHTDYFKDVVNCVKTFEVRKNDRNFKRGDVLILREVLNNEVTGQYCTVSVKYILKSYMALHSDYVVLGIYLYDVHLKE